MIRNFDVGVMPSLVPGRIAFGVVGAGVFVYDWDGREPVFHSGGAMRGDPDLSPDGLFVGYFDDFDKGRVVEIATGRLVLALGVVRGNHAIRLRNGSVVYQKQQAGIYERDFDDPAGLRERRLGDYSATGLAYLTWEAPGYVTTDDNLLADLPMLNPSRAGNITAGSPSPDGFGVRLDGEYAEFDRGVNWLDCRVVPGAIATWSPERGVCRLVTDIRTLDDVARAFPSATPAPVPVPVPPSPPEPPMPEPVNHADLARDAFDEVALPPPPRQVEDVRPYLLRLLSKLPAAERFGYVESFPGADNTVNLSDGTPVRVGRVMTPDGQIYKVMNDVPNGGPQWAIDDVRPELYVPYVGSSQPDPGTIPPTPGTSIDALVQAKIDKSQGMLIATVVDLENAVESLGQRIAALEDHATEPGPTPAFPTHIALQVDAEGWPHTGKFLSAHDDGDVRADRDEAGAWETFKVIPK